MKNTLGNDPDLGKPKKIWVIGGGRFGRIAVERIMQSIKEADILLVDKGPVSFSCDGVSIIRDDGVGWIKKMLDNKIPVDLIVPALPIHLFVEWFRLKLKNTHTLIPIQVTDQWLHKLPHGLNGRKGQVFVSHADFICPDNCSEPRHYCTHTGKPRPRNLFQLLADVKIMGVVPIVVRSHQLLPGVGGILPRDFIEICDKVSLIANQTLMIGTACRCHGVVDFLHCVEKE